MIPGTMQTNVRLQGIDIELHDYHWPEACASSWVEDRYILGLSLTPPPAGSHAHFALPGSPDREIGKVVFMPAGVPMIFRNDGGPQRIIRCRLTEARFRAITGDTEDWTGKDLAPALDLEDPRLVFGLQRLFEELQTPNAVNFAFSEALVQDLVIDLMNALGRRQSPASAGGLTRTQLRRIGARMMQADKELPSVTELAAMEGLSSRHLLRAFRASTGSSLREHLNLVFKRRAVQLLKDSSLPVTEIAAQLGYNRISSFSTAFRNVAGVAPSAYRGGLKEVAAF
jgi:AraC family transcriptional regulator